MWPMPEWVERLFLGPIARWIQFVITWMAHLTALAAAVVILGGIVLLIAVVLSAVGVYSLST